MLPEQCAEDGGRGGQSRTERDHRVELRVKRHWRDRYRLVQRNAFKPLSDAVGRKGEAEPQFAERRRQGKPDRDAIRLVAFCCAAHDERPAAYRPILDQPPRFGGKPVEPCRSVAMLAMVKGKVSHTQIWLAVTGLFGLAFLSIEIHEFSGMIAEGATPQRSAFLSSFFTLVGTHGLHVTFGIVWLVTLMVQVWKHGLIVANRRRLMCLSMFWHFLDVVWIGVFTFVYLMGMLR